MEIDKITGSEVLVVAEHGKTQAIYKLEEYTGNYIIFIARRDRLTHDFLSPGAATSLSSAVGYIERDIALNYPDSQKFFVRENSLIDFSNQNKDLFDIQFKSEGKPSTRAKKDKPEETDTNPTEGQIKKGQNVETNQTVQENRAETKEANNNLPENLQGNTIDDSSNQNNFHRVEETEPGGSGVGNSLEGAAEKAENAISGFFGNGQRATSTLKGQLEDYVVEGGSPILGALGATGLDVLDLAMGFAESTALGILDIRNFGEGIRKRTFEGVKEDAGRLLNVLPQGKIAKAVNTVLTVSDIVDAAEEGDAEVMSSALSQFPTLFMKSKKKSRRTKKKKRKIKFTKDEMKRIRKNLKENQREWIRARVEELRKEGHSDNYIRQTIRGQIAEVGLNMDAKIYNRLIELYLKKK